MALLVDDPLWPAHGTTWAHLVSDSSLEELHEFARANDLPGRAFDLDHYDVPASALPRLVAAGAVPVDRRALMARLSASGLRVPQVRRAAERRSRRVGGLRARWTALGEHLGGARLAGEHAWSSVGENLLHRWREPHRHYHDERHLDAILLDLDTLAAARADVTPVVELAAWWHDAVHTGRTPQDEEASAELARSALADRALARLLPPGTGEEAARLVLTTADHRPTDNAAALLCDADLAILAAPSERYAKYVADVRLEYPAVPDHAFAAGRAAVLRSFLDTERIYSTDAGRSRWEQPARANISAELADLATH